MDNDSSDGDDLVPERRIIIDSDHEGNSPPYQNPPPVQQFQQFSSFQLQLPPQPQQFQQKRISPSQSFVATNCERCRNFQMNAEHAWTIVRASTNKYSRNIELENEVEILNRINIEKSNYIDEQKRIVEEMKIKLTESEVKKNKAEEDFENLQKQHEMVIEKAKEAKTHIDAANEWRLKYESSQKTLAELHKSKKHTVEKYLTAVKMAKKLVETDEAKTKEIQKLKEMVEPMEDELDDFRRSYKELFSFAKILCKFVETRPNLEYTQAAMKAMAGFKRIEETKKNLLTSARRPRTRSRARAASATSSSHVDNHINMDELTDEGDMGDDVGDELENALERMLEGNNQEVDQPEHSESVVENTEKTSEGVETVETTKKRVQTLSEALDDMVFKEPSLMESPGRKRVAWVPQEKAKKVSTSSEDDQQETMPLDLEPSPVQSPIKPAKPSPNKTTIKPAIPSLIKQSIETLSPIKPKLMTPTSIILEREKQEPMKEKETILPSIKTPIADIPSYDKPKPLTPSLSLPEKEKREIIPEKATMSSPIKPLTATFSSPIKHKPTIPSLSLPEKEPQKSIPQKQPSIEEIFKSKFFVEFMMSPLIKNMENPFPFSESAQPSEDVVLPSPKKDLPLMEIMPELGTLISPLKKIQTKEGSPLKKISDVTPSTVAEKHPTKSAETIPESVMEFNKSEASDSDRQETDERLFCLLRDASEKRREIEKSKPVEEKSPTSELEQRPRRGRPRKSHVSQASKESTPPTPRPVQQAEQVGHPAQVSELRLLRQSTRRIIQTSKEASPAPQVQLPKTSKEVKGTQEDTKPKKRGRPRKKLVAEETPNVSTVKETPVVEKEVDSRKVIESTPSKPKITEREVLQKVIKSPEPMISPMKSPMKPIIRSPPPTIRAPSMMLKPIQYVPATSSSNKTPTSGEPPAKKLKTFRMLVPLKDEDFVRKTDLKSALLNSFDMVIHEKATILESHISLFKSHTSDIKNTASSTLADHMISALRLLQPGDVWNANMSKILMNPGSILMDSFVAKQEAKFFEFASLLTKEDHLKDLFEQFYKKLAVEIVRRQAPILLITLTRNYRCFTVAAMKMQENSSDEYQQIFECILKNLLETNLPDLALPILCTILAVGKNLAVDNLKKLLEDPNLVLFLRCHLTINATGRRVLHKILEILGLSILTMISNEVSPDELKDHLHSSMEKVKNSTEQIVISDDGLKPTPQLTTNMRCCITLATFLQLMNFNQLKRVYMSLLEEIETFSKDRTNSSNEEAKRFAILLMITRKMASNTIVNLVPRDRNDFGLNIMQKFLQQIDKFMRNTKAMLTESPSFLFHALKNFIQDFKLFTRHELPIPMLTER